MLNKNKYTFYGLIFGFTFPVAGLLIQCWLVYTQITFSNLIHIEKNTPLLWIINTIPLISGFIASIIGNHLDLINDKNKELIICYKEANALRAIADKANKAKSVILTNDVVPESKPTNMTDFKKLLKGLNVLIVEDSIVNQRIIIGLLSMVGVNYDVACNGLEALNLAQKKNYDTILMDIQMPVMDGLTATKEIRKIETLINVPIIALTAHESVSEKHKSLIAGINEHITKPINPSLLYDTIYRLVKPSSIKSPINKNQINNTKKKANLESFQFHDIKYINTIVGLEIASNNMDLYLQIIAKYISSFTYFNKETNEYWEDKDWQKLMSSFHNIGGVAANIGANILSKKALTISSLIKSQKSLNGVKYPDLVEVIKANNMVIADINKIQERQLVIDKDIVNIDIKKLTDIEFLKVINELLPLVNNNNPIALEFIQDVRKKFQLNPSQTITTNKIGDALDEFEFEEALLLIKCLL